RSVALVRSAAHHRVRPGADPALAVVGLRAGVAVGARRAVRNRLRDALVMRLVAHADVALIAGTRAVARGARAATAAAGVVHGAEEAVVARGAVVRVRARAGPVADVVRTEVAVAGARGATGIERAGGRTAVAADGVAVVAFLHRVEDAVPARHAARPEARRVEGGGVDGGALGVRERVAGGGAARLPPAALEAVPAELRDLRLALVGGMEAVAAGHVTAGELVEGGAFAVPDLYVGRLHCSGDRQAAGGDRRVLRGDPLEDLVVGKPRDVGVDAPLVRAVLGERRADVDHPPDRAARKAQGEPAPALAGEVAEFRDAGERGDADTHARDLDQLIHATPELALEGGGGGAAVVVRVLVAAAAVAGAAGGVGADVVVAH